MRPMTGDWKEMLGILIVVIGIITIYVCAHIYIVFSEWDDKRKKQKSKSVDTLGILTVNSKEIQNDN